MAGAVPFNAKTAPRSPCRISVAPRTGDEQRVRAEMNQARTITLGTIDGHTVSILLASICIVQGVPPVPLIIYSVGGLQHFQAPMTILYCIVTIT